MNWRLSLLAALAPSLAFADAKVDGIALFDQGMKDFANGNIDAACRELAASLALYPDSGTKGALAECQTAQGKLASAWRIWRALEVNAPSEDLRSDAASKAAALEPRLARYVIAPLRSPPPDLVVVVDGTPIDPTLSVPLPVDPPSVVVTVRAPNYEPWTGTFQVSEGKTTTIEIPPLREVPPAQRAKRDQHPEDRTTAAVRDMMLLRELEDTRHARRVLGLSIALGGVVAVGVGAYFGLTARASWNDAVASCGGSLNACPSASFQAAQDQTSTARVDATTSTILFAAGGAALAFGGYVWFTAPTLQRSESRHLTVTPAFDVHSAGFVVSGHL